MQRYFGGTHLKPGTCLHLAVGTGENAATPGCSMHAVLARLTIAVFQIDQVPSGENLWGYSGCDNTERRRGGGWCMERRSIIIFSALDNLIGYIGRCLILPARDRTCKMELNRLINL